MTGGKRNGPEKKAGAYIYNIRMDSINEVNVRRATIALLALAKKEADLNEKKELIDDHTMLSLQLSLRKIPEKGRTKPLNM